MLGGLFDRLRRRRREEAAKFQADLGQMSPADRRVAGQSIDDSQADEFVRDTLGGGDPGPRGDDEPPPQD